MGKKTNQSKFNQIIPAINQIREQKSTFKKIIKNSNFL